jgi:hypothetical protein
MPILQNNTKERKRRQDVNEEKWGMTRIGRGNGTKHITALHKATEGLTGKRGFISRCTN